MNNWHLAPQPFDWPAMLPMIVVFITGVAAMTIEMIYPRRNNNAIVWTCLLGLAAAATILILRWEMPEKESLGGLFFDDYLGRVTQLILVGVTGLTVLYSEGYLREKQLPFGEYYPLLLWSAVGGMIMVTSRDFLIIFLGIEVLSISLYILAGLSAKEKRSQESSMKYFLLGSFASAFLLYGIALIYGATGTTKLYGINALVEYSASQPEFLNLLYAGIGLALIGFAFKIALVPFHMWTPDVYQGAPTVVTGFMAAGAKVAAFVALIRVLDGSMAFKDIWIPILTGLAILTMTIGNLIALVQRDAKRILGYSSIAQAGYVMVAIVAYASLHGTLNAIGLTTVAYYLLVYSFMTIGAFAVLSMAAKNGQEGTSLQDLYGLWQKAPFPAAMMILFMASLAGIPPTAGFFGKLLIFRDALNANLVFLAIMLAINSVISVYYYLKIALAVSVQKPEYHKTRFSKVNAGLFVTCLVCGIMIIALSIGLQNVKNWMGLEPSTQQTIAQQQ